MGVVMRVVMGDAGGRVEEAEVTAQDDVATWKLPAASADALAESRSGVDEQPTEKLPAPGPSTVADAGARTATAVERSRTARGLSPLRSTRPRLPIVLVALLALLALAVAALPFLHLLGSASPTRPTTLLPTPTAMATLVPTATPGGHASNWLGAVVSQAQVQYVDSLIAHMSLDEEIGQMIMVEFSESAMTPGLAYEISHYHVGSVILYAYNVQNADQTRQLDQSLQANANIPLLISTDQEGGPVNRLYSIVGLLPSAEQIGVTNNPAIARQRGEQDASQLYQLGINTNMAPVVDVRNIPDGEGALGGRMFGTTPQQVTNMAGAYLSGLQEGHHVVGALKHFPGLGDVPLDPHLVLPTLNRSLNDLRRIDWAPYASLISTGQVAMVMVTHEIVPAVDPQYPSSLSHALITGVLRDQLHFQGVVVTDGIYMQSLAAHYTFDQIVLLAVQAGVDIISSTYSLASTDEAEQVIRRAVVSGALTKARIDDSVRRILLLKLHYGLLTMPKAHS
jgi:beta-N-acetylhexosaminidase